MNTKEYKKYIFFILIILLLLSMTTLIFIKYKNKLNKPTGISNNNIIEKEDEEETANSSVDKELDQFEGLTLVNDNRGVPILTYHSIANDASTNGPITLPKELFRKHLQKLKDDEYTTLTMSQLNDYILSNKPIPENSVVIAFDDGYMDNYTNAFPLLKEFNMNATFFIISDYSISNNVPGSRFMSSTEIKEMSDYGMDMQSHTVSHPELSTLSYEEQLKELTDSKAAIENLTGKAVTSLAYPLGSFNEDTKKASLEAGYSMSFTIDRGYADRDDNQFELNRICIDYTYNNNNDISKVLTKLSK